MFRKLQTWFVLSLLFLVVSCVSFVPEKPETFKQQLAYAYGTLTAVRYSTADLINTGRLSPEEGRKILEQTDAVRLTLDISRESFDNGDMVTAHDKLVAAQQVLLVLQNILRTRMNE